MSVLEGLAVKWEEVGGVLDVPRATREAIRSENSTDAERLHAIVIFWLMKDPDASWRRLIWRFDCSDSYDVRPRADSIRNYAEKVSG